MAPSVSPCTVVRASLLVGLGRWWASSPGPWAAQAMLVPPHSEAWLLQAAGQLSTELIANLSSSSGAASLAGLATLSKESKPRLKLGLHTLLEPSQAALRGTQQGTQGAATATFTSRGLLRTKSVPAGLCGYANESSWSGYFEIDPQTQKNYFYWGYGPREEQGAGPGGRPTSTILWLTGGPGCSSQFALATENGPCSMDPSGSGQTVPNPYAWNQKANVVWVDQPAGAGFSYADELGKAHNEEDVARDLYRFLQALWKEDGAFYGWDQGQGSSHGYEYGYDVADGYGWDIPLGLAEEWYARRHPWREASSLPVRGTNLTIVAESYGGHYAPALAKVSTHVGFNTLHDIPYQCHSCDVCIGTSVLLPTYRVPTVSPSIMPSNLALPCLQVITDANAILRKREAAWEEMLWSWASSLLPPYLLPPLPDWMQSDDVILPLHGVAIGNGLTRPDIQYQYYPDQGHDYAAQVLGNSTTLPLSQEQADSMRKSWPTCKAAIQACQSSDFLCAPAEILCNWMMIRPYQDSGLSPYDMRKKCDKPPLCTDTAPVEAFFNREDVRAALGIPSSVPKWTPCNMMVNLDFASDWMKRFDTHLVPVLGNGTAVLIYAGDMDFICNWLGNEAWTLALEWPGQEAFSQASKKPWVPQSRAAQRKAKDDLASLFRWAGLPVPMDLLVDKESEGGTDGLGAAGQVRSAQGLTFLQVYGAGHMVPADVPSEALDMINAFLAGVPLA